MWFVNWNGIWLSYGNIVEFREQEPMVYWLWKERVQPSQPVSVIASQSPSSPLTLNHTCVTSNYLTEYKQITTGAIWLEHYLGYTSQLISYFQYISSRISFKLFIGFVQLIFFFDQISELMMMNLRFRNLEISWKQLSS